MIASGTKALTLFVMNPLMLIFFFGLLMKMVEQFYNKNNLQCKWMCNILFVKYIYISIFLCYKFYTIRYYNARIYKNQRLK